MADETEEVEEKKIHATNQTLITDGLVRTRNKMILHWFSWKTEYCRRNSSVKFIRTYNFFGGVFQVWSGTDALMEFIQHHERNKKLRGRYFSVFFVW
ncbi:hypothetical protein C5167_049251 [Papaver somniferum]|uniref:Uncharacterized protein n=1 Tax=Papaver somniferum TaxID=3469 RepID=A0A4Y7KNL9_PAPSO|nr:hypothetical protein C5167_049251 [Papaver somniferum]